MALAPVKAAYTSCTGKMKSLLPEDIDKAKVAKVAVFALAIVALVAEALVTASHFGATAHTLAQSGLSALTPFGAGAALVGTGVLAAVAGNVLFSKSLTFEEAMQQHERADAAGQAKLAQSQVKTGGFLQKIGLG